MGKTRELNPYFALQHGFIVSVDSIKQKAPQTMAAVSALIEADKIVGQYAFTLEGNMQDMLIWMPEKMKEREAQLQSKLRDVRGELRAISLGHEDVFNGDIVLEEGIPLDIRIKK